MGDLCLTDPGFSPASFEPWVADEARSKEATSSEYAKKISAMWKEGIESWGQSVERVQKFHDVKKTIYTPGSSAGVSINIMSSLEVPPAEIMEDSDTFCIIFKKYNNFFTLFGRYRCRSIGIKRVYPACTDHYKIMDSR